MWTCAGVWVQPVRLFRMGEHLTNGGDFLATFYGELYGVRRGFLGDISKVILDVLGHYFTGFRMAFYGVPYGVLRGSVWRAPL